MTTKHDDGPDAADEARVEYAAIDLGDGGVVIYDSSSYGAWIQSDAAVDLDSRE